MSRVCPSDQRAGGRGGTLTRTVQQLYVTQEEPKEPNRRAVGARCVRGMPEGPALGALRVKEGSDAENTVSGSVSV